MHGAGKAVRIHAESESREAAAAMIERMRFALGTDHDLSEFQRRFRWDPLIGPVIRASRGCGWPAPPGAVRGARLGGASS